MDTKNLTYELIAQSFKKLVLKKDFKKITVKMIAAESGIMRSTFYNYFQDKYEILEWIVKNEISDKVLFLIEKEMYVEALRLLFSCIEADKAFYSKAFEIKGQNGFEEILAAQASKLFREVYKSVDFNYPNKVITLETISQYQSLALVMYIRMWICDNCYGDANCDEVCDAYMFMLTQGTSLISPSNVLESLAEKFVERLPSTINKIINKGKNKTEH